MNRVSKLTSIFLMICYACLCQGIDIAAKSMSAPPVPRGSNAKGTTVNLPYQPNVTDLQGNGYNIDHGGYFRQQGNMPYYNDGGHLVINNADVTMTVNQGRVEENGELVIENMGIPGGTFTRRFFVNREDGYVRIIDIFKNTGNQETTWPVIYRSNLMYGIRSQINVPDPKRADHSVGICATDGQGRGVLEIFAGKGSKLSPAPPNPQNNGVTETGFTLKVAAGKEIALMHLHATNIPQDQAGKYIANLHESKVLSNVPQKVRRLIANFVGGNLFINDDVEILRGEVFDVAELRGGDTMTGTIKNKSWKLKTFYGPVELAADKVIALVNVGDSRPRQLLVTADGQIFGGYLDSQNIEFELSSGQTTKLPLTQISRLGYRKRMGEPEEWPLDQPMVQLRSGERITILPPTEDIAAMTRYGPLKIKPSNISSISFENEDNGMHNFYLTDGSKFGGLAMKAVFELHLADSPDQLVKIPVNTITKLQIVGRRDESDEQNPGVRLANDDLLVADLTGPYQLDTTFDTIALKGEQIKSITHSKTSPMDVVVKLWDKTSLSGQLQELELNCQLKSGITLKVPVALLNEYSQPAPKPSDTILEQVKLLVTKLNSDDWKVRDDAQKQLASLGSAIVPSLKQLRGDQPPEAQQRLDDLIQNFNKPATPNLPTAVPNN